MEVGAEMKTNEEYRLLEQQLSEWLSANSPGGWIDDLRKQLAEREKQVAMLRSYLNRWAFTQSEDECAHMEVQEALAETADLKDVVLCDAEPVAWLRKWSADKETPAKVKGDNGRWHWPRKFKILPITEHKWFEDDLPLFMRK
jgi:hypothetical protein